MLQRVEVAKARIESLNPMVKVDVIPSFAVLNDDEIDSTLQAADLICVTEWDRERLVSLCLS